MSWTPPVRLQRATGFPVVPSDFPQTLQKCITIISALEPSVSITEASPLEDINAQAYVSFRSIPGEKDGMDSKTVAGFAHEGFYSVPTGVKILYDASLPVIPEFASGFQRFAAEWIPPEFHGRPVISDWIALILILLDSTTCSGGSVSGSSTSENDNTVMTDRNSSQQIHHTFAYTHVHVDQPTLGGSYQSQSARLQISNFAWPWRKVLEGLVDYFSPRAYFAHLYGIRCKCF
ncbi:hypothetical protein K438DRAFT_1772771 [Mycena galopus ATCC 62051]|nr:hypothetical protein K438DRAFT_1772771 [Mycena galopus ATCC 62051]